MVNGKCASVNSSGDLGWQGFVFDESKKEWHLLAQRKNSIRDEADQNQGDEAAEQKRE
jgi:hypothetical protein